MSDYYEDKIKMLEQAQTPVDCYFCSCPEPCDNVVCILQGGWDHNQHVILYLQYSQHLEDEARAEYMCFGRYGRG